MITDRCYFKQRRIIVHLLDMPNICLPKENDLEDNIAMKKVSEEPRRIDKTHDY